MNLDFSLPGKAIGNIFSPPKAAMPEPLPPPPKEDDPAIEENKKKVRQSELRRRGRKASILTSGQGTLGEATTARPEAGAQLLGS